MAKSRKSDAEREQRIDMEIVLDAYDANERAMGWYCYLDETLGFPFTARCIVRRAISPLEVNDEVEVVSMSSEDECRSAKARVENLCHEKFTRERAIDGGGARGRRRGRRGRGPRVRGLGRS